MTRNIDIKFVDDPVSKKTGYIVVKNSFKSPHIDYDCLTSGLITEHEIDEEINRLAEELEEVRKKAKEKLKR